MRAGCYSHYSTGRYADAASDSVLPHRSISRFLAMIHAQLNALKQNEEREMTASNPLAKIGCIRDGHPPTWIWIHAASYGC